MSYDQDLLRTPSLWYGVCSSFQKRAVHSAYQTLLEANRANRFWTTVVYHKLLFLIYFCLPLFFFLFITHFHALVNFWKGLRVGSSNPPLMFCAPLARHRTQWPPQKHSSEMGMLTAPIIVYFVLSLGSLPAGVIAGIFTRCDTLWRGSPRCLFGFSCPLGGGGHVFLEHSASLSSALRGPRVCRDQNPAVCLSTRQ